MNGKMRSIALPRAIDSGTLVPKTMNFRLATIMLLVGVMAVDVAPAMGRSLSLEQSWALLHGYAYPQSERAITAKFGKPHKKNAVGRWAYSGRKGWISCGRSNGKVTDCLFEGK
jgi:hypothetical protein